MYKFLSDEVLLDNLCIPSQNFNLYYPAASTDITYAYLFTINKALNRSTNQDVRVQNNRV